MISMEGTRPTSKYENSVMDNNERTLYTKLSMMKRETDKIRNALFVNILRMH